MFEFTTASIMLCLSPGLELAIDMLVALSSGAALNRDRLEHCLYEIQ